MIKVSSQRSYARRIALGNALEKQAALPFRGIMNLNRVLSRVPAGRVVSRADRAMRALQSTGRLTPAVGENLRQVKAVANAFEPVQSMQQAYWNHNYLNRLKALGREDPGYVRFWGSIPTYARNEPSSLWYTQTAKDIARNSTPVPDPFTMARKVVTDGNPRPEWFNPDYHRIEFGSDNAVDQARAYLQAIGYAK